jgi:starvation-inducible DNA-binding protein
MFKTKNDLPEASRARAVGLFNARLADCIDLQTQIKQAHQINEAVEDYVDDIAERAVQLGGIAEGTARMVAKRSSLAEYPAIAVDGCSHVDALSSALAVAFPDNPRPLRGDLVPHADRPGWTAVTDGTMERSAARGHPQQRSTYLTERAGCLIESPVGGNRSGRAVALQGDDGTNDLPVSNVIRINEMQVWFVAEHVAGAPLANTDGQADNS